MQKPKKKVKHKCLLAELWISYCFWHIFTWMNYLWILMTIYYNNRVLLNLYFFWTLIQIFFKLIWRGSILLWLSVHNFKYSSEQTSYRIRLFKQSILQQITLLHMPLLWVPAFVQNVTVIEVLQCLKRLKIVVHFWHLEII